jgi:hypothetical protein
VRSEQEGGLAAPSRERLARYSTMSHLALPGRFGFLDVAAYTTPTTPAI